MKLKDMPNDYQIILAEFMDHIGYKELPEEFETERRMVWDQLRTEVVENALFWDPEDWMRAYNYAEGWDENVPPLIVAGKELRDGYHRTMAALLLGIEALDVIDLNVYRERLETHNSTAAQ